MNDHHRTCGGIMSDVFDFDISQDNELADETLDEMQGSKFCNICIGCGGHIDRR